MAKPGPALLALVLLALSFSVPAKAQNPVVVELFTSEGCSSCPPADAVLADLSRVGQQDGTDLILLGEHVDYWNYLGWTDRFSSAQFSQRQSEYAHALHGQVYTPEMVIDGRAGFVGNSLGDVQQKIAAAERDPKPAQVALAWANDKQLQVKVSGANLPHSNVLLAITENNLTTAVGAGENGGTTLHHAAVVRQLRNLGTVKSNQYAVSVDVTPAAGWNTANLKVAVLVQDASSMAILGAGEIAYK